MDINLLKMRHVKFGFVVSALVFLFLLNISTGQSISQADTLHRGKDKFQSFHSETFEMDGHVLPYRLYQPEILNNEKYPLVVFFHGAGERGDDNQGQLKRFDPVPFWLTHPCYVVAPQCPRSDVNEHSVWVNTYFGGIAHTMKETPTWPMLLSIELVKQIINNKNIDHSRIYVTGLSMGGYATWEILQREVDLFAAAIPVCGGGDVNYADKMVSTALWVFHGAEDRTVPVNRSQDMVNAIKVSGGNPNYTEYQGVDHDSWSRTYQNPEVWEWLFNQTKKKK
jgi:predicted peptidase